LEHNVTKRFFGPALAMVSLVGLASTSSAHAATCSPTGFFRDGIEMTAALINPVTVASPLDATGCNIGVYYDTGVANLNQVDIYGANYFGVLVNGDDNPVVVHFNRNLIHNIGEVPFNGTQHGSAIYIRAFFASTVTGDVTGNVVSGYQKGGIVVNGKGVKLASVNTNQVFGLGHVSFIAQNGIQIGYGAQPTAVRGNVVTGNSYIGFPGDGSASGGILVVGGPGYGQCPDGNDCPYTNSVPMVGNTLLNNDVGVYASNLQADFSAAPTPTTLVIAFNLAGDDQCYNQSYQAGISDQGNTDFILFNYIAQGGGYGPSCGPNIDTTGSINPIVVGNVPAVGTTARSLRTSTHQVRIAPEKP
jgi:hypothetical protein